MFIPYGFASEDYITTDNSLTLEKPLVLVVNEPITEIQHLVKTLEFLREIKRPLILFSPEIKKEPLSVLIYNQRRTGVEVN